MNGGQRIVERWKQEYYKNGVRDSVVEEKLKEIWKYIMEKITLKQVEKIGSGNKEMVVKIM